MLTSLIAQVEANCELASYHQAGYFSLCGLLLRLRLLYKWKHGLPPWREAEPDDVLAWIADLETTWDAREGDSWQPLPLDGLAVDPFEVEKINSFLEPGGLAYGAGFSRGLAPTFFLGELAEARRQDDLTILVLDKELARDLDGTPAMCQGNLIYVRRQSLAYFLWDHLADPGQQSNRFLAAGWPSEGPPLADLLKNPKKHRGTWDDLVSGELEAFIGHEVGEARENSLRRALPAILELFCQTPLELWIRALKDALAEVHDQGRLAFIIAEQRLTSLALMLAFQPGLYPLLLPELEPAFWDLVKDRDWELLETARQSAQNRLRQTAAEVNHLLEVHRDNPPDLLKKTLTERFLSPLGL
ncbi:MAG: Sfum_1244 family protein [Thermodesulfobacteriota bacterium]